MHLGRFEKCKSLLIYRIMHKHLTDICAVMILGVVIFLILSSKKKVESKRIDKTDDDKVDWL